MYSAQLRIPYIYTSPEINTIKMYRETSTGPLFFTTGLLPNTSFHAFLHASLTVALDTREQTDKPTTLPAAGMAQLPPTGRDEKLPQHGTPTLATGRHLTRNPNRPTPDSTFGMK